MKEKIATAIIAAGIVIMCIGLSGCLGQDPGQDDPSPSPGSPDTTQPTTTPAPSPPPSQQYPNDSPGNVQYPNEETLPNTGGIRLAP